MKITYKDLRGRGMNCLVYYEENLIGFYDREKGFMCQNIDGTSLHHSLLYPYFLLDEVVMLSPKKYVGIVSRFPTHDLILNGRDTILTGLNNKTTGIASYQNGTNQHIIHVADNDGKCVKMYNLVGKKTNEFQYTEGRIIRMCVKDRNTLIVLNDNNMIQEIDMTDGGVHNEDLIDSVVKEKITTFSYCKPYLWVAVNNRLIRFK